MKRRIIKITLMISFVVLVAAVFMSRQYSVTHLEAQIEAAKEEGHIPVVLICPLSGSYAYVGEAASWSAGYAVRRINDQGGVNGQMLELIVQNTDSDTAKARSAVKKVKGKLLFVIGPVTAPESFAAAEEIASNEILSIGTYSFDEALEITAPYGVSYMSNSDLGEWASVRRWAKDNPDIKNVVLFTDSMDTSKAETAKEMTKRLTELGLKVIEVVDISADTSDHKYMKCAIQALNMKADGYISLLSAKDYGNILCELRRRGVDEGRRITGSFSAYTEELIEVAGENLDGTYIWNKFNPEYDSEEWQALVDAYRRDHNGDTPMSTTVVDIYDSVIAIKDCFETLKITGEPEKYNSERQAVGQWFYNSGQIQGIQGSYRWENGEKIKDYEYFIFKGTSPDNV